MSLDTESGSPSLRDTIEASYASHSSSPDVGSAVNVGIADRDHQIRTRDRAAPLDRFQREADDKYRRHSTITHSVFEKMREAAAGPQQPAKKHEAQPGPPQGFDLKAKGQWHDLPQETRLAYLREQSETMNAIEGNVAPRLREHAELEKVLAPHRETYRQYGLKSDAEYVNGLTSWHRALSNPTTRVHAAAELLVANGVSIPDLFAFCGAPEQYQQYAAHYGVDQQPDPVQQHIAQCSQGKTYFEAVRPTMVKLLETRNYTLPDGRVDLDAVYNDAVRHHGLDNHARRATSPQSRSPAVRHDTTSQHGRRPVRSDVLAAIAQHRG